MKNPKQFERVLELSFVAMFFIYTAMAVFGYLQFGDNTKILITENLVKHAQSKGELFIGKILIGFVIASCYFQISPVLSVIAAIPEHIFGIETSWKRRTFRTYLFVF